MITALGLALYGPLAASTRYRLGQYVPGLRKLGIDLRIRHLLGDDYLRARFAGGSVPVGPMLRGGLARLVDLSQASKFDVAIMYGELFPLLPGRVEQAMLRLPYVYDFDDAFQLRYRTGRMRFAAPILGQKFDQVIAGAAAVTSGNSFLAQYAKLHNPNVTQLPTVVDIERYQPTRTRKNQIFTIGWIGSPSTAGYLEQLVRPLEILGRETPLNFVVVGGKAPRIENVNVHQVEWQESSEIDCVNSFDVGVMPLPDDEWARGKCAFKLIQYMACAVPVVASPVGANLEVVTADCGSLAAGEREWVDCLRTLRDAPTVRQHLGDAGRERVVKYYSLHSAIPRMADVIFSATKGRGQ